MMLCYFCMHEKGDAAVCPHCGAQGDPVPLAHQLRPGTVIGGRYVVGRVLGEGGFGITYLGYHPKLGMTLAIKEYFPNSVAYRSADGTSAVYARSQDTAEFFIYGRERFLSEAKTLVRFSAEPGIVSVIDFIEENGTAYLIMEYLDGVTLQQYLKQRGTLSAGEAFSLLKPVMQTLEKVHAAGVIHRDISPDNIMRLNSGQLKLMDFGAAREFTDEQKSLSVMLKKGYAPAEQYNRRGDQGPWTDVYALCATVYRCITGKAPVDSLDRVFEDDLTPPSQLGAVITPEQEKVLLYGLAVREKDRCQNISELLGLWDRASEAPDRRPQPPVSEPVKTVAADKEEPTVQPENKRDQTVAADIDQPGDADANATMNADVEAPAARSAAIQQPEKKPRKKGIIIVSLIAIIAVIAVVVVLIKMPLVKESTGDVSGDKSSDVSGDKTPVDYFEYTINGDAVTITKYTGEQAEVNIPAKIEGKPVTSIGESAFSDCDSLTSVKIPNSVMNISSWAFFDCDSLTSVTIPDSVTGIGDSAFSQCSSLTSVTIPDSVTGIGSSAFFDCDSLTSVTIPGSVTTIGDDAFFDCDSLTAVTIPDSVTSIGFRAFSGCDGLTSVTIPDSVTDIGEWAFNGCRSLTSVTIPDSVTKIGDYAFYYCSSDLVIYGRSGSEAESYAKREGVSFVAR